MDPSWESNATKRRRLATEDAERRRLAYIQASKCASVQLVDGVHELAEMVQVFGRRADGKHAERLCGAYQRVEEPDGVSVLYQRLESDTGTLSAKGPFLMLAARDGKKNMIWRLTNSLTETRKGFAYNEDITASCPTRLSQPWLCYDGRENGYNPDDGLKVVEVPIGFWPVTNPSGNYEVTEKITDGPAAGTLVRCTTEPDQSQRRRLEPRAYIHLPNNLGGDVCRGRVPLMNARTRKLSKEDRLAIWDRYVACKHIWQAYVDKTYVFFVPSFPTLFYRRITDLTIDEVTEHGIEAGVGNGAASSSRRDAHNHEQLQQDLQHSQAEPRPKVPSSNTVGADIDPFMKYIVRSAPSSPDEGGHHRNPKSDSSGPRRQPPPCSSIEEDFKALCRRDERARMRVLAEAPQRPWYDLMIQKNVKGADLEDEFIDELWVWMIAACQDGEGDDRVDMTGVLSQLASITVREEAERLRPTLARLLAVSGNLCCRTEGEGECGIVGIATVLTVAFDMLESRALHGQRTELDGGDDTDRLSRLEPLARFCFKVKAAHKIFDPRLKKHRVTSPVLSAAAFGVVLSKSITGDAHAKEALEGLRAKCVSHGTEKVSRRRLIAFFIGVSSSQGGAMYTFIKEVIDTCDCEEDKMDLEDIARITQESAREGQGQQPQAEPVQPVATSLEVADAKTTIQAVDTIAPPSVTPVSDDEQDAEPSNEQLQRVVRLTSETLNCVLSRLRGGSAPEDLNAATEHYKRLFNMQEGLPEGLKPSQRVSQAIIAKAEACQDTISIATLPFFLCADALHRSCEVLNCEGSCEAEEHKQHRKNNLLRACIIWDTLIALEGQHLLVKVAALLKRATVYRLLDDVCATDTRSSKICNDHKQVYALLQGKTRSFNAKLSCAWGCGKETSQQSVQSDLPTVTHQASAASDEKAGAIFQQGSPPRLVMNIDPPAGAISQQANVSRLVVKPNQERQPSGKIGVAQHPSPSPAQEHQALAKNSTNRMRTYLLRDLRPGLSTPWRLDARIQKVTPFKSNTGFFAQLECIVGGSMIAFFFRQSATVHSEAMRPGLRLRLMAKSGLTFVRKADEKFGGSWQLVVGNDAIVETEGFRLGRLPPEHAAAEVWAVFVGMGRVEFGSNGEVFRTVSLVDESVGAVPTLWYAWGTGAVDIPENLPVGTIMRVEGAVVKFLSRVSLARGRASIWPTGGGSRADELRTWYESSTKN